jgi:AcrR family transcriptional regulator
MGSRERILMLKENTKRNILKAALKIVKQDGWQSLSMRKIADEIEYTAPVIYEYFTSKETLVAELSNTGYLMLAKKIREAKNSVTGPVLQLEAMWLAYWQFAFAEKELYQSMFGIEVNCSRLDEKMPRADEMSNLFSEVIRELIEDKETIEYEVCTKYFTLWSVVHGLVSINLIHKGKSDEINQIVLHEAIRATIASINK